MAVHLFCVLSCCIPGETVVVNGPQGMEPLWKFRVDGYKLSEGPGHPQHGGPPRRRVQRSGHRQTGCCSTSSSTRRMPPPEAERGSRGSLNSSFQVAGRPRQYGTGRHRGTEGVGGGIEEGQDSGGSSSNGGSNCLEREVPRKKRLAVANTELQAAVNKKSQCEQEIAEAEADLARMREDSASGEEPKTEVQQLRARVAQLEEIWGRHVRGSEEAAEHIRTKAAKRRVGGCAEDVLPSTEQDLACWLDDRQTELRDALDMADMESASAAPSQASSPGGSPRWRVLFHHRPHSRAWCREESDKVGIQGHQSGRGVPSRSSPSRKFVGR